MSKIDALLERSAAEIRDTSAMLAVPHSFDIATSRRGFGRATLVVAAFAATIVLVGGTAVLFSGPSGQPAADTSDDSVAEPASPMTDRTTPPTTGFVFPLDGGVRSLAASGVTASSELSDGFAAIHLIDGDPARSWNDASLSGDGAVLTFDFREPVFLDTIVIHNYDNPNDPGSFSRNFRIRDFDVEYHTVDGTMHLKATAPDSIEPFAVRVADLHDGALVIRVLSVWPAEPVDDAPAFLELAIGEVEFFGSVVTVEWMESAIQDVERAIAAFEGEIATLTSALETASPDAAEEIQDRLASANFDRDEADRRLLEMEKRLVLLNESRSSTP